MNRDLYSDRATRLDTVAGDNAYWRRLGDVAKEWMAANSRDNRKEHVVMAFNDWLEQNYGFRAVYDEDGGILGEPDVRDDQKYMLFLLKYTG